jgi:hypothetical protein
MEQEARAVKHKPLITIAELLKREGHWLGGKRPKEYMLRWNLWNLDKGHLLKYPNGSTVSLPAEPFDYKKAAALFAKLPDPVAEVMNQPNEFLLSVPWRKPKKGKRP